MPGWELAGQPLLASDAPAPARVPPGVGVDRVNYVQQTVPAHETCLYRLKVRARFDKPKSGLILEFSWFSADGTMLLNFADPMPRTAGQLEFVRYDTSAAGCPQPSPTAQRDLEREGLGQHAELVRMDD